MRIPPFSTELPEHGSCSAARFSVVSLVVFFMSVISDCGIARAKRYVYQPQDPSKVDFYIMTVGLGPEIYMRYGHTILKMVDKEQGEDYNFNWGVFDFDEPDFGYNYFKGKLLYSMGSSTNESILRSYRDIEKRRVWQEKLNLTVKQKSILINRIFWNMRKENRKYEYHHFYNNCSTKLRDYIDEALGGKIEEIYRKKISKWNFRDYVVINLSQPPLAGFALDIVMNSKIDGTITNWEEMFYPEKLREILMKTTQFDDAGNAIPGTRLLSNSRIIVEGQTYLPSTTNVFQYIMMFLGLPLLILSVMARRRPVPGSLVLGDGCKGEVARAESSAWLRVTGVISMVWGAGAGFFGVLMTVSWMFSGHQDILHNANLWLFWPLDGLFVVCGAVWLVTGRPILIAKDSVFWKMFRNLVLLHLFAIAVYVCLYLLGKFEQNIENTVFYLVPIAGMLYLDVFLHGFCRNHDN